MIKAAWRTSRFDFPVVFVKCYNSVPSVEERDIYHISNVCLVGLRKRILFIFTRNGFKFLTKSKAKRVNFTVTLARLLVLRSAVFEEKRDCSV